MKFKRISFLDVLENIVDNRGKTCPVSDSGIPLIATNCVRNDSLYPTYDKVRYVSKVTYETWFRGHPKPGDMLFVTKGTPGRVCWVPDPVDFCIAQDMVSIRAKSKVIYPKYLFALLRSKQVQNEIENMHVGTLIPHFKKGDFDKLFLSIAESSACQEKIGDFYFEMSEKIELNRQTNQTLEAVAQAIYKEWFVNFNFPGATGEMQDSEIGPIPKGWRTGLLGEIVEFIKGVSYRSAELMPSKYALVTLKSIARGGGFNNDGFKEFDGRYKESQTLIEGDTVIAQTDITQNAEVVGCPAIVENPFNYDKLIASIDIVKCLPKNDNLTAEVIYYFLKDQNFKDYCLSHTNGSTVLHLRSSELPNYKLAIPDKAVLNSFCQIVRKINSKMMENNRQVRTLVRMRDSLLPRVMNGEIKV